MAKARKKRASARRQTEKIDRREVHGMRMVSNDQGAAYIPTFSGGMVKTADESANVKYFPARWQSPLLSWTNYYIPWDRATLFQWIRHYDTFHPLIGSCIDLHTQLPLSRFGLRGINDRKILQFYEEMMDELDAYVLMYEQLREWWLVAEVFTYLVWDDTLGMFTKGRILPPEYIDVRGHSLVIGDEEPFEYFLIPDDELKMFINATDETSQRKKEQLPPEVVEAVLGGMNIKINPFNLMVMMRKQSGYNPRGTSLVLRALKDLLYEDKIREAQYAIADRCVLPKEIWRIGDKDSFKPSKKKLASFAELVRTLEDMPKFNLVTHYAVNYEVIGMVGKFPQLASEFDWVEKRILSALFTTRALVHGEGPTYANASVAMRALMGRYQEARSRLETSWIQHIFLPVAIANGFYKITQAQLAHGIRRPLKDREPIIPDFDWRYKTNLLDDASYREVLLRLRDKKMIPMKLICEALHLDYDSTQKWLEEEQGTIFDPDYNELYRKLLYTKGIEPSSAPKLLPDVGEQTEQPEAAAPPVGPAAAAAKQKATAIHNKVRKQIPLKERKGKVDEEDTFVPDEEMKPKDYYWMSRGGLLRKVEAAELLLKAQKEGPTPLDKIEIYIPHKDNIEKVPDDIAKQAKRKSEVIVVSDSVVIKNGKKIKRKPKKK